MKKATSVQEIKNVKDIIFSIDNYPMETESKLTIVATTDDDIFEFVFEGSDLLQSYKKSGLFTGWEKDQRIRELKKEAAERMRLRDEQYKELEERDQKIRELEKELGKWKKEVADCLRLRDKVRREKNKEINELKWQLQMAVNDKKRYEEKIKNLEHADMLDKNELEQENKTKCENCLACASLVDDYLKLAKKNKQLTFEKSMIKKENEKLKKELSLEKAANEAQRKFIQNYAGKGTEVQFNYAIDEVKEVSYVIVDRDKYNKDREKWANAQVENAPASTSRADILDQAKKCVCGQREQDYGTPESNFQLIADLWNGYFGEKTDNPVISVTPVDVSMMMALMKIARIRNGGGSGDSFVDLAGYAACGGEIWHGQKVKDQN